MLRLSRSGSIRRWYSLGLGAIPVGIVARIAPVLFSISPAVLYAEISQPLNLVEKGISAEQLLQAGDRYYQAGQMEPAIAAWKQAQSAYRRVKNRQGEATALANLGMAYVTGERYRDAVEALEAFLGIA